MAGKDAIEVDLLEREHELSAAREALLAAREGRGSMLVIRGEAGIGKTQLLRRIGALGDELGFATLSGRGGDIERDLPWGLVRELFDPAISARNEVERAGLFADAAELARSVFGLSPAAESPAGPSASIYGLYWLLLALAADRPVLALVDDAHWIDDESLRWLTFLASRLAGLPAAVVVAVRRHDPDSDRPGLTEILAEDETGLLEPSALSKSASERLIASILGASPSPELIDACQHATRGNPFLLGELVRELGTSPGFDPASTETAAVTAVPPRTIVRAVLLRLARLPDEATALARSVAILGSDAAARDVATLAGLEPEAAASAHHALARAGILSAEIPLDFVHPLVRATIYEEMPSLQRSGWHDRAARILAGAGADETRVVPHLLDAEPGSDPWARGILREAGRTALARGAPDLASRLLGRAADEAVAPANDSSLLLEIGRARFAAGGAEGLTALEGAFSGAEDAGQLTETGLELGRALHALGNHPRAATVYDEAHRAVVGGPQELRDLLRAHFIYTGLQDSAHLPAALELLGVASGEARVPGPADDIVGACMALGMAAAGAPAADAVAIADRSLADGWLQSERTPALSFALTALTWADELERVAAAWDRAIREGHEAGEQPWVSFASCFRSQVALRMGDLTTAETAGRDSIESAPIWDLSPPDPASFLCEALLEQGRAGEARAVLETSGYDPALPGRQGYNTLLMCRARLGLAQNRTDDAESDLRELGRRLLAGGVMNPAAFPWRSTLAPLLAADDPDEAAELATTELDLARAFGAPRAIGVALAGVARITRGVDGLDLLRESIEVLADSPARLEHARATVDLGGALRRTGHDRDARDVLRDGLAEAERLGATALAERARDDLVTAGARPRRDALRGRDALTASEMRVARLAANGLTNAEIARSLFVVMRTVETHLTSTYRKLEITSRTDLEAALSVRDDEGRLIDR